MLQTEILSLRLHGFIEYKKNKRLMLVVSGNSSSIDELVVYIMQMKNFKSNDFVIKEEHWDYPIKVGFKVITNKTKQLTSKSQPNKKKSGNDV